MFIILLLMFLSLTIQPSDKETVKQIAQDCKKETYHTGKKSLLDKALEKEIEILAKTNPDKYQKLVQYNQQLKSKKTVQKD